VTNEAADSPVLTFTTETYSKGCFESENSPFEHLTQEVLSI